MDVATINRLLQVTESFKASFRLAEILQSKEQRKSLFLSFLEHETDLSFDWFTDYFQEEHSNRKDMMQDFTPDGITSAACGVLGETASNLDVCAGTGGLTIKMWSLNPTASFHCIELSERAFPFLLFNLAIRNISGSVIRADALTKESFESYELTAGERFSEIVPAEPSEPKVQTAILNPPYSLPWQPDGLEHEPRFKPFGAMAPKSKADYAFVLTALDRLDENGRLLAILPHGVLFRGSGEGTIRENLIRMNLLDAIIGLPEKSFLNTAIPTAMLVLKKGGSDQGLLVIDAKDECTKGGKQNYLEAEHIQRIVETYRSRAEVKRFSHIADLAELEKNDFNLNIPRYVDTYVRAPITPLYQLVDELSEIDQEIAKTRVDLAVMMEDLTQGNVGDLAAIAKLMQFYKDKAGPELVEAAQQEAKAKKLAEALKPKPEPPPPRKPEPPRKGEQLSLFDAYEHK